MRRRVARVGWIGLAVGLAAVGVGALLVGGSAIAAGSWWLARQPWIGLGLQSLVFGMAVTAVFSLLLVLVEPIGWLRLLAAPPAVIAAITWFFLVAVGPLTFTRAGTQAPRPDPMAILYALPELLLFTLAVNLLIASPLLIARLRRRSQPLAPQT